MQSILPPGWKRPSGYSNGIVAHGRTVFVAGQIGWDPRDAQFKSDDFVAQYDQALQNVLAVVREAGGGPEHVARMTTYVTDKKAYLARLREVGEVYRARMGKNFPAMALVQASALVEDRAQVEIEATAVIP